MNDQTASAERTESIRDHFSQLLDAMQASYGTVPEIESGAAWAIALHLAKHNPDRDDALAKGAGIIEALFSALHLAVADGPWLRVERPARSQAFAALMTAGYAIPVATKIAERSCDAGEFLLNWLEYFGNFVSPETDHGKINMKLLGAQIGHDQLCTFIKTMHAMGASQMFVPPAENG